MILGIETSCDETAAAVVTDDGRVLSSVVSSQADLHAPLRRRRARGRLAAPPRARLPGRARGARVRRGRPLDEGRASRRDPGPRARGSAARRHLRGQGDRVGAPGCRSSRSTTWRATSHRSTSSPTRSSRRSRACSRAAATRCSSPCASAGARNGSARRSTTPRARPSTRAPGCSGSATRAVRRSIGSRRRAIAHGVRLPGRARPGPRLLLLRTEDRVALRRPRPRPGRDGAPQGRSRRLVPAGDRARSGTAPPGGCDERRVSHGSRSSAASRRTPSCATPCPTPRSRPSRCAPTTRR